MLRRWYNISQLKQHCNEWIIFHKTPYPPCHPERSGMTDGRASNTALPAAESNPEGAPAGGISAVTQGQQSVGNDPRVVPPDSPTNLNHFYPVAERGKATSCRRPNPAGRDLARSSRNSQHGKRLHQNPHHQNIGVKIPLIKVLKGS